MFFKYIHRKEHSFMTFLKNAYGGCSNASITGVGDDTKVFQHESFE